MVKFQNSLSKPLYNCGNLSSPVPMRRTVNNNHILRDIFGKSSLWLSYPFLKIYYFAEDNYFRKQMILIAAQR